MWEADMEVAALEKHGNLLAHVCDSKSHTIASNA